MGGLATLAALAGLVRFRARRESALHRRRQGPARGSGELFHQAGQGVGDDPASTIDRRRFRARRKRSRSGDLARKAIDRLGLATNPEFDPDHDGKVDQRVVDKFLSRLTVFPVPRSRVLQIEFVSRDPELAARGANTVAEVYLQSLTEAKASAARTASTWLPARSRS